MLEQEQELFKPLFVKAGYNRDYKKTDLHVKY